ncbi:MAG: hypothetical protein HDT29_03860 [Clostridiales bacterium]|nr:hypothetical protein [Clostridiales bacterium]
MMFKLGFMLGIGAGAMVAAVMSAKKKTTDMMEQGKKALKEKIIKVLE